ncbi:MULTISPECIES: stage II sporulation protein M [Actinomyces]|uniref:Stage II sporulation protein M n=1 Tax=Actinomyces respiraculi TaxID=2744574 RepID=A0A7T0PWL1_9ACTO|nr:MULTISPECIES: stage II sporulation protein M [Actinomyces]QPL05844.1 stage II sporulation protein M [Actinomyces respiraculi]
MDIDAFSAARRDQWDRLDELTRRRQLTGSQADELVALYRGAARDLSRARTQAPDPQVLAELSRLVVAARARVTGTREVRASDLRRYLAQTVPAALYRLRWWTLGVTLAELAIAVVVAVWTLHSPQAMSALGSPSELSAYANDAFESYYSTYAPSEFASQVWTNNARIAVLCVAGGITGVLPAYVMWANAVSLGQAAAIMVDHDLLGLFFALISPHGLLELTCVFIAGAAGLKLFWTMLVPGPRPRAVALAEEGRALIAVAVGMTGALAVAGVIEAFVTPAPVPWSLKITVGVLALVVLWTYTLVVGGRAVRSGVTGDLDEEEAGAVAVAVG